MAGDKKLMKRIELKNGKIIETPWLRVEEAAAYCGVARSTFMDRVGELPYSGDEDLRLYHCDVLDRFINGEMPDASFKKRAARERRPRRYRQTKKDLSMGLVDPGTGKIYAPRAAT
jgi:hypothetical protein